MNKSVRVPLRGDTPALGCPGKEGHSDSKKLAKGWGRVIRAATSDAQLTDADTRVYDAMCQMERHGRITCGVRYIGSVCNKSKSETARCILHLIGRGYVERLSAKTGSRAVYRLTASIFAEKKHQTVSGAHQIFQPRTPHERRQVKIEPCLQCAKPCVRSKADGWCRSCSTENKMARIARREIRLDRRELA